MLFPLSSFDLLLDLLLSRMFVSRYRSIEVEPYILRVSRDDCRDLFKDVYFAYDLFKAVKLEIGAEIDVLRDEVHLDEGFLDLLNTVRVENSFLEVLFE